MLRSLLIGTALLFAPAGAFAQFVDHGGGPAPIPTHSEPMTPAEREALLERLHSVADSLRAAGVLGHARGGGEEPTVLDWPLRAADHYAHASYFGVSNFVDHDAAFPNQLLDYQCGARTYDLPSGYNHRGLDIFTWPYGWAIMDDDAVEIVAAADGVILLKSDGHFDRQCTFNNSQWNAVYLGHDDGTITWYGHMKNGSLTPKAVGESVAQGEFLGIVGSSGSSTGPHIHFEVYGPGNQLVDPYAGACNEMNEATLWAEQPDYFLPYLNAVMTHSQAPGMPTCPDTEDVLHDATEFERGDVVYLALYYRDQLEGQITQMRIVRPSGTTWYQWQHSSPHAHLAASYWYWALETPANAEEGVYQVEAFYNDELHIHHFTVGQIVSDAPAPVATPLALDVFPNPATTRTQVNVRSDDPVTVRVLDLLGREVMVLHNAPAPAGPLALTLDTERLAPGSYVVTATTAAETTHRRLTVVR